MGCIQSQAEPVTTQSYSRRSKKRLNACQEKYVLEKDDDICHDKHTDRVKSFDRKKLNTLHTLFSNHGGEKSNNINWLPAQEADDKQTNSEDKTGHKTKFPKWRKYEKCTYCVEKSGRRLSAEEDIIRITSTRRKPGGSSHQLCKRCSKTSLQERQNNLKITNLVNASSLADLLALSALDLTAPASDALLKNRKNAWIQLAGHPGSFAPAGPRTIWKKRISKENYETKAYEALMDDPNTNDIMPCFHREVEYNGEYFIEMEDLLQHFSDPNIMDIKMGKRTFLESEVKNPVLRKDLYEKMVSVDPDTPTPEEREQEAITKLRYMQFRENESSTAELGFRIEAVRMSGEPPNTNLKKIKSRDQVKHVITKFLDSNPSVISSIRRRLDDISHKFHLSSFFRSHEIIGSSLLVMYDKKGQSGVWMIDFAKTIPVEANLTLNHRSPWQLENHEDGYLSGLDHLIDIFKDFEEVSHPEVPQLERTET